MSGGETIDPRYGIAAPTSTTLARRGGSIRRTSTIDSTRPDGIRGRLVQHGRARDLLTSPDPAAPPVVLDDVALRVVTEYTDGPVVREISLEPAEPTVAALVGVRASAGFRRVIDDAVDVRRGSVAYLLLDDVPGATLVSGVAVVFAAERDGDDLVRARLRPPGTKVLQVTDLCAGWQAGGTMIRSRDERGYPPLIVGPLSPSVDDPTDGWAWHPEPALPADSTRRRRRVDVWRDDDGTMRVDAFFRDSHMAPGGVETGVHEYTVEATVDADTMVVERCVAIPRVLPWRECPEAVASAGRLAGMPVGSLRPEVRAQLVGPSTCTHLNDVLRGLEDVESLAHELSTAIA